MDAKNEKPSQLGGAHCSEAPRSSVCENGCPSSPGLPRDRKQKEGSQANIKQSWLCWIMFMPGNKQDRIAWFKDAYAAERALKNWAASSWVLPSYPALCSSFTNDVISCLSMVMGFASSPGFDLRMLGLRYTMWLLPSQSEGALPKMQQSQPVIWDSRMVLHLIYSSQQKCQLMTNTPRTVLEEATQDSCIDTNQQAH